MKIIELMLAIKNLDAVLPEFQREYVWELEDARQLIWSLFRDYPTGSLLFWKTNEPPEIKNNAVDPSRLGSPNVILDGQQRLTTLFLLTQNEVPPYYTSDEIKNDPRDLYFNLEEGDFQYFSPSRMDSAPQWVAVTECFTKPDINPFQIAEQRAEPDTDKFAVAQKINTNLTRLRNILERIYPVQTVPASASIDEAIDVFDRVNSLGTKLTQAELALAHICGKWPQARRVMKEKINEYGTQRFYFDLPFMVRALTAVVRGRAIYGTIHDAPFDELSAGWTKTSEILDYLIGILPKNAFVHSTEDLSDTSVLVTLVGHLSRHGTFEAEAEMRRAVHWLFAASTWERYTTQTTQRLDHDLSIVVRSRSPWGELVEALGDQVGRIELMPGDLEGRGNQHSLYRMMYVLAKATEGIDWCNGEPLEVRHGGRYQLHSRNIFPVSKLYEEGGYDRGNHLHSIIVDEIANHVFLTRHETWLYNDESPEKYLPDVVAKHPDALDKQFVPSQKELWSIENYEEFLKERRRLIANAFNRVMRKLLEETAEAKPLSVRELIAAGESATLEFKSSLRWDLRQNKVNKEMQKMVAKTVAGFLNTEGGTLLIGVADDGTVLGIEDDIKSISRKDLDGFLQSLFQTFANHLGESVAPYVNVTFEAVGDKQVCKVRVGPSKNPVFVSDPKAKEFYIRFGSATRSLDVEEAQKYIVERWE